MLDRERSTFPFDEVKELAGVLKPILMKQGHHTYQLLGTHVDDCASIADAIEHTVIADSAAQHEFVREGRWGNTLVRCVRDKVASLRKRLHHFREEAKDTKNMQAAMKLREAVIKR